MYTENMQNETLHVLRIHAICDVFTAHWYNGYTDTMRNEAIHKLRTLRMHKKFSNLPNYKKIFKLKVLTPFRLDTHKKLMQMYF
jgi:hypothetical protein